MVKYLVKKYLTCHLAIPLERSFGSIEPSTITGVIHDLHSKLSQRFNPNPKSLLHHIAILYSRSGVPRLTGRAGAPGWTVHKD